MTLKTNLLGEHTAEHDHELLLSNFIETPEYRLIIESKSSTVVVGRRGTGKSAMFAKLNEFWGQQKSTHVISIAPTDDQTIYFRSIFKCVEGKYSFVRSFSKLVWKYGLLLEMLDHLSKNFKTRERFASFPTAQSHVKIWQNLNGGFFYKLVRKIAPYTDNKQEKEILVGELSSKLDLAILESDFIGLLQQSSLKFFIIIDRLDEGYENDETGAAIISGVIATIAELNKQHISVRPVIFQRDNILRSVQKFDPDYSRNIEGEVISIHWDSYQLLNLAAQRLKSVFKISAEKNQKIWDACTIDTGTGRELQGEQGFKRCLQFTLYRPRDLLSLLNQAFYEAAKQGRKKIILEDIEKTAKNISVNRLEDLKKEYAAIIPSLPIVLTAFERGNAEIRYHEVLSLIENISYRFRGSQVDVKTVQDYQILGSVRLIAVLYSVGFIGTHDENSNTFVFCHDGRQPDRQFNESDRILIHPCYWIALNISRNALLLEEAEQINDEYEIKVTSNSLEFRQQRIGALIAEIGSIEEGNQGAHDFEKWVLSALQTIFAGHLGNIERSPNGAAISRRDIVGTNLEHSPVWIRIFKDYDVRQVVFDAKNYKNMKQDEFRQMSSYLTGSYGRLGFLISRDEKDELQVGAELDCVREVFNNHQKLIVRLSCNFLKKMLNKLRSVKKHDEVDHALAGILDTYERRYLSLPSSRKKRD